MEFNAHTLNRSGQIKAAIDSSADIDWENIIIVAKSGADYDTIAGALAVAVSGDLVLVMPGVYEEWDLTVPVGVSMMGFDRETTSISAPSGVTNHILKLQTQTELMSLSVGLVGAGKCIDITTSNIVLWNCTITTLANSASDAYAIYNAGSSLEVKYCEVTSSNSGAGAGHALYNAAGGTAYTYIAGGNIESKDDDALYIASGHTCYLYEVPRIFGTITANGDAEGIYAYSDGDIHITQEQDLYLQGATGGPQSSTERALLERIGHILDRGHPANPYPATRTPDDAEFNNATQAENNTIGTHAGGDYWEQLTGGGYSAPFSADINTTIANCLFIWKTVGAGSNPTVYKADLNAPPGEDDSFQMEMFVNGNYSIGDNGYVAMKLLDESTGNFIRIRWEYDSPNNRFAVICSYDNGGGETTTGTKYIASFFVPPFVLGLRRTESGGNAYGRYFFAFTGAPGPRHCMGTDQVTTQNISAKASFVPDRLDIEFYAGTGGKQTCSVDSIRSVSAL
jgi:hypothetical protein